MKFSIKKLYENTIHTLEKHQMEVTIAIAALSMVAFGPEDPEETKGNAELKALLEDLNKQLTHKIDALKLLIKQDTKLPIIEESEGIDRLFEDNL